MTNSNVVFVDDIAKMFRISPGTLQRKKWRDKTGIPLRKIGKKLCGLDKDLEKWFKEQE